MGFPSVPEKGLIKSHYLAILNQDCTPSSDLSFLGLIDADDGKVLFVAAHRIVVVQILGLEEGAKHHLPVLKAD